MSRYEKIKTEFLTLLNDKPYIKVSMTELAYASGMSRQNLYRHYSSKDQVLSDILQEVFESILDNMQMLGPKMTPELWLEFIRLSYDSLILNKHSISAIVLGEADEVVYGCVKSFVNRLLGHIARVNHIRVYDQEYFDLISQHITGSIFHVIKIWIENGMNIPAERMAKIHQSLLGDYVLDLLIDTNACTKRHDF